MKGAECSVALDMGTTSIKAIAVGANGRELARAEERVHTYVDASGMAEQDPDDVLMRASSVLAAVCQAARERGFAVARVGLSSAMHSLVAVGADGCPLTRAITWMDTRAAQAAQTLWDSPAGREIYRQTGAPVHAMTPLAKLLWLRDARPEVFAQAAKFVSLKEWVWWNWFGEWRADAAIAGASGLYDLHTGQWNDLALAAAGLTSNRLSDVVPTTYTRCVAAGDSLCDAGLTPGTPVTIGASDGVLANLGAGVIDPQGMVITVGTSCAVRTGVTQPITDEATRSFCYVLAPGKWIVGGPSNSGGVLLDWLYQQWTQQGQAPADGLSGLLAAAESAEDAYLLCLPYLTGERAPLWDAHARAAWVGLQVHHTPAHWVRAAVEGILFNAYWIAEALIRRAGRPQVLIASGKLFNQRWIVQFAADLFGVPVRMQSDVDASLLGAIALAHVAGGAWTWEEAAEYGRRTVGAGACTPDAQAHLRRQEKFERFRALAGAAQAFTPSASAE